MAKDKPYQFKVELPEGYDSDIRQAIASEIISFVRQRTLKGIDADGDKFKGYSKGYINSVNFKATGKSKGKINLTLSGDMLANIDLVKDKETELVLGYDDNSDQAGKAEGNQIGSYGKSADPKKARKFLGLQPDDLKKILSKYPIDSPKADLRAEAVNKAQEKIDEFASTVVESKDDISVTDLIKNFKIRVGNK